MVAGAAQPRVALAALGFLAPGGPHAPGFAAHVLRAVGGVHVRDGFKLVEVAHASPRCDGARRPGRAAGSDERGNATDSTGREQDHPHGRHRRKTRLSCSTWVGGPAGLVPVAAMAMKGIHSAASRLSTG